MAWRRLRAKLVDGQDVREAPVSESRVIGESTEPGANNGSVDATDELAAGRPARRNTRARISRVADDDQEPQSAETEARLLAIKRAATRIRRVQKAAVDLGRNYRIGQRVYDPISQSFGRIVFAAEGYVRIELSEGGESAHGKPPLSDRRAFVQANFARMDNRTMAEILDISVHTMRRLCHEYGLKRHGKKKLTA